MDQEKTTYVKFEGVLDIYRRDEVTAALPPPEDGGRVVIDCSAVQSIDSSVIGALMRFRRDVADAGHDPLNIVIVAPPAVRRILEIAGLVKQLTVITAGTRADVTMQPPGLPEPT